MPAFYQVPLVTPLVPFGIHSTFSTITSSNGMLSDALLTNAGIVDLGLLAAVPSGDQIKVPLTPAANAARSVAKG